MPIIWLLFQWTSLTPCGLSSYVLISTYEVHLQICGRVIFLHLLPEVLCFIFLHWSDAAFSSTFFILISFRHPVFDFPKHFSYSFPKLISRAHSATVRFTQAFSCLSTMHAFYRLLCFLRKLLPRFIFLPLGVLVLWLVAVEAALIRIAPIFDRIFCDCCKLIHDRILV